MEERSMEEKISMAATATTQVKSDVRYLIKVKEVGLSLRG
jgi:hypothetical protein